MKILQNENEELQKKVRMLVQKLAAEEKKNSLRPRVAQEKPIRLPGIFFSLIVLKPQFLKKLIQIFEGMSKKGRGLKACVLRDVASIYLCGLQYEKYAPSSILTPIQSVDLSFFDATLKPIDEDKTTIVAGYGLRKRYK